MYLSCFPPPCILGISSVFPTSQYTSDFLSPLLGDYHPFAYHTTPTSFFLNPKTLSQVQLTICGGAFFACFYHVVPENIDTPTTEGHWKF